MPVPGFIAFLFFCMLQERLRSLEVQFQQFQRDTGALLDSTKDKKINAAQCDQSHENLSPNALTGKLHGAPSRMAVLDGNLQGYGSGVFNEGLIR